MKTNSKNRFYCAFFLILVGTVLCTSAHAAGPTADELRKRAATLEQKVSLCEKDLAQGAKDCLVIVNWEGNRKVSMAEARTLASRYLAEARQLDTASASNVLPGWRPDELSNPQIQKIARSLDSIKVPPPIPSTEASINWNLAADHSEGILEGADYGMLAWDVFGKIGSNTLAARVLLIAGKIFIAGEDGALVFVTKRNETYDMALKYLKNPKTSKQFAYLVKELKEKGETSTVTDQDMIKAAKAIADPALGSSTKKLVWDAMLSPEATAAMAKKACLEIGTEMFSTGATGLMADLTKRQVIFDAIRLERNKAVNMLKYASDSNQRYELNRVIAHANKQLEFAYRTEQAGPKIMGFMAGQYLYKEAEK